MCCDNNPQLVSRRVGRICRFPGGKGACFTFLLALSFHPEPAHQHISPWAGFWLQASPELSKAQQPQCCSTWHCWAQGTVTSQVRDTGEGQAPTSLPCSCTKCEFEGLWAQVPGPFFLLHGVSLPEYFLQLFPTNFVAICWIPLNEQHCTEVFSSQQSLEGGESKLRDRKSQLVHLPC